MQHFVTGRWTNRPTCDILPLERVQVTLDSDLCESKLEDGLIKHAVGRRAEEYIMGKMKLGEGELTIIDWDALKASNMELSKAKRATRSKFVYRWAATGV